MNRSELKAALDRFGVTSQLYESEDELLVGPIGLSSRAYGKWWPTGKWCVYYLLLDERTNRWCFDLEDDACENLMERVIRIQTMRNKHGMMNKNDLRTELNRLGVPPKAYDLEGMKYADSRVVLKGEANGSWSVYSDDRGKRLGAMAFDTETAACEYFVDRILSSTERFGIDQWG